MEKYIFEFHKAIADFHKVVLAAWAIMAAIDIGLITIYANGQQKK